MTNVFNKMYHWILNKILPVCAPGININSFLFNLSDLSLQWLPNYTLFWKPINQSLWFCITANACDSSLENYIVKHENIQFAIKEKRPNPIYDKTCPEYQSISQILFYQSRSSFFHLRKRGRVQFFRIKLFTFHVRLLILFG